MKLKSLLKNKNFLYFVLFIASVNTFGYLMMRRDGGSNVICAGWIFNNIFHKEYDYCVTNSHRSD